MNTIPNPEKHDNIPYNVNERFPDRRRKKPMFGIVVVILGIFLLLDQIIPSFDMADLWPVALIIIGIMIGIRNKFSNNAPYVLMIIGAANLIPVFHIGSASSTDLVWPAILILFGLSYIFRAKKTSHWEKKRMDLVTNGENNLRIDVTMGGRKEIVTSKEFRGGKISTTFGGTEVNLMQADSTIQPMVLDIAVSFGSVELIVPSHWEVINEIRPSMGSVEDHRHMRMDTGAEKKTLYLRGSCSFGSVELKSY